MNSAQRGRSQRVGHLQRQLRILLILDGCRLAGLSPLAINNLHLLAYLANTLAPVWDIPPMDAKLIKKRGGPFYPDIQGDVDRLIGMGLVEVFHPGHELDEDGRWRVTGAYRINSALAASVVEAADQTGYPDATSAFLRELTYAVSGLALVDVGRIPATDATYADPIVSVGDVIDFGEWRDVNYTANAARHFRHLMPGQQASSAEMTHMYLRLAAERLNAHA